MAYDSPKAAHFEIRHTIDGKTVDGPQSLDIRWQIAREVEAAGVNNLLSLNQSQRETIGKICKAHDSEIFNVRFRG